VLRSPRNAIRFCPGARYPPPPQQSASLQRPLEFDPRQGPAATEVILAHRGHQGAVGKGRVAKRAAHPVRHDPARLGTPGNHHAAGAHAEGIGGTARLAIIKGEAIVSGRQRRMVPRAVLNPVDQRLRMLHPDPDGKGLRLQHSTPPGKHLVSIPGAVARGEHQGITGELVTTVHHNAVDPLRGEMMSVTQY